MYTSVVFLMSSQKKNENYEKKWPLIAFISTATLCKKPHWIHKKMLWNLYLFKKNRNRFCEEEKNENEKRWKEEWKNS